MEVIDKLDYNGVIKRCMRISKSISKYHNHWNECYFCKDIQKYVFVYKTEDNCVHISTCPKNGILSPNQHIAESSIYIKNGRLYR